MPNLLDGISVGEVERILGSIDWEKVKKERRERQSNCSHEKVYSAGPSHINGRWKHEGYFCLDCGLDTDANHPIGPYKGQRFNPSELDKVFYQTIN